MYALMRYDTERGWVVMHRYESYALAFDSMSGKRLRSPNEQFDISHIPSKRKPRKKVSA